MLETKLEQRTILEVKDISVSFGGLKAVDRISFDLHDQEITGLIGPNGAGKTTVFNLLTGVYTANTGSVRLFDENIMGLDSYEIVAKGMTRTFQNIRLFKNMSVLDNIKVGFQDHAKYSVMSALMRSKAYWQEENHFRQEAMDLLDLFEMGHLAHSLADNLPYGAQRKLEICRALATKPHILLLDEPAAGMNASETASLMETIRFVRDKFKIAILLIEHDMQLVMGVCERLVVINYGRVIANGLTQEVRNDPEVIRAYLGSEGMEEDL